MAPLPKLCARNHIPEDPSEYISNFEAKGEDGSDEIKEIVWSIHPCADATVTAPRRCKFGDLPTLSSAWKKLEGNTDPEAFLKEIITPEIIELVVKYTNMNAEHEYNIRYEEFLNDPDSHGAEPMKWKPVDATEIWAFFGALIYMGVEQLGGKSMHALFGHNGRTAHLLLLQSFTRDRFLGIMKYIRFHDRTSDPGEQERQNKRRKIQEFIDPILANCRKGIIPSKTITVDESLLSFKSRNGFVQYLKNKPDKYGLKFFTACDAPSGAILNAIFYVGKEGEKRETGQNTRVVLDLVKNYAGSGRCVVTDRYYTSCRLADGLANIGLDCVGTAMPSRQGIPKAFASLDLHRYHSSKEKKLHRTSIDRSIDNVAEREHEAKGLASFLFSEKLTLVKYEPSAKKSAVYLLSTVHHQPMVATENGKPEAVLYYNSKKFGVDLLDQLVKSFSTKRTSRRWPMRVFFWLLDVAAIQAYIAYRLANPKVAKDPHLRRKFMDDLAVRMTRPHCQRLREIYTPRQTKVNLLQFALRFFQRKTNATLDNSLSISERKRLVELVTGPRTSAAEKSHFQDAKRSVSNKKTVQQSRYVGRKQCQAVKGCRKSGKVKCDECGKIVCPNHRHESGGKKKVLCNSCFEGYLSFHS